MLILSESFRRTVWTVEIARLELFFLLSVSYNTISASILVRYPSRLHSTHSRCDRPALSPPVTAPFPFPRRATKKQKPPKKPARFASAARDRYPNPYITGRRMLNDQYSSLLPPPRSEDIVFRLFES
ncbi:unnamed protein product, partial [Laminaria digitata]